MLCAENWGVSNASCDTHPMRARSTGNRLILACVGMGVLVGGCTHGAAPRGSVAGELQVVGGPDLLKGYPGPFHWAGEVHLLGTSHSGLSYRFMAGHDGHFSGQVAAGTYTVEATPLHGANCASPSVVVTSSR